MIASDRIRQWLLRAPRPTSVRIFDVSGDTHTFVIPDKPRWRDVADDIVSLQPAKLHALDDGENLLRVETIDGAAAEVEAPGTRDIPIPAVLSSDPETMRLTHFANLLARAHENSNHFTREMMEMFLNRTDRLEERLERTEAAYQAEFHARVQEKLDTVGDDDMRSEMAKLFFNNRGSASDDAPKPPSNGAPTQAPKGWS